MCSPDDSHRPGRTVRVAPREIVDLVSRILRVHGVDPATAAAIGTDVMRCTAVGHGAIEAVLGAIDDDTIAELGPPHRPVHEAAGALALAYRDGIEVSRDHFRALERASSGFLVDEHVLDAIADETPVD